MNLKMTAIFLILIFCSCETSNTEIINYTSYYDKEHKQQKVVGEFFEGEERGEWMFYDVNGNVNEKGNYVNGLQDGMWQYNIPSIDSVIYWVPTDFKEIKFSLPSTYKLHKTDTSKITYIDTVDGTVIGIWMVINCDSACEKNYYQSNLNTYKSNVNVVFSQSTLVKIKSGQFYIDDYEFMTVDSGENVKQFMVYKALPDDKMIVLSIVNTKQYENKLKFLLGQLFYHIKYNYERVAFPYDDIYTRIYTGKWD